MCILFRELIYLLNNAPKNNWGFKQQCSRRNYIKNRFSIIFPTIDLIKIFPQTFQNQFQRNKRPRRKFQKVKEFFTSRILRTGATLS